MKKLINILTILSIALLWTACNSEKAPEEKFTKVHSLSNHGLSMEIKGPEDLKIEKKESLLPYEFKLTGTDFDVHLYGYAADQLEVKALKDAKKEEKSAAPNFELVTEEDHGFIYSTHDGDTTKKYYNFCYVLLQGDNQFEFTSSAVSEYNKQQVEDMYKAVKQ